MGLFSKKKYPEFWKAYESTFSEKLPQQIEENRFVVFDTETTGLNPSEDKLLSMGAVSLQNNKIVVGCNVENAAYPQTQCAEASAIGNMISQGEKNIVEVLVIGSGTLLCSPCGGCRQRLRQFASLSTPIHMCNENSYQKTLTLEKLLPESDLADKFAWIEGEE